MDYAAASDALVGAAWAVGAVASASALGMIVLMFVHRAWVSARAARRAARAVHWRARLLDAMTGKASLGPDDVPWRERVAVVDAWCRLHDVLRGNSRRDLGRVLAESGLDDVCRLWIRVPRPLDRRLLGIAALGHLGARADWARLRPLLDARQTWLGTAALQGLLRIDPPRAAQLVLERLHLHPDWPRDVVRAAFHDAGTAVVTPALLAWLETATPDALAHGLPLVECGDSGAMQAALLPLLRADLPMETLTSVVRWIDSPRALPALRGLATHPAWQVRTQVANALGRVGGADDHATLRAMLADRFWWVRHRAAQALLSLPGHDDATLAAWLAALDDGYAREALRHAASERWRTLPEPVP